MTLETFQQDLQRSYVGGGPGTIISGLVWAIAAIVSMRLGISAGFAALFFGGMLIFPVGSLLCRYAFRRAAPDAANPGGRIVIETLPGMFVGLFIAYLFVTTNPDYVFPVAAMAVGAHYYSFRTAYGDILYWLLGAVMIGIGAVSIVADTALPLGPAALIAIVEIIFGIVLTVRAPR